MTRIPAFLAALLCVLTPARATEPLGLTDRVHLVLLAEQPFHRDRDEDPRARAARLRDVAAAVSSAVMHARCKGAWKGTDCRPVWRGSPLELAAALLAWGRYESHWSAEVQSGNCAALGPRACDHNQARGPWQAWAVACPQLHQVEPGSDAALREGAWCSARLWAGALRFCTEPGEAPNYAGAFSRAGLGGPCMTDRVGPRRRAAALPRILNDLQRASLPAEPPRPWPAIPKLPD
jgi:hypothetical protein